MNAEYTPMEKGGIEETFNIGASTASTALSKLIGGRVDVERPEVHIGSPEACCQIVKDPDRIKTIVQMELRGDLRGRLFLMMDPQNADMLASKVLRRLSVPPDDRTLLRTSLMEITNILSGAALTAMGKFLGLDVRQHLPHMITDMAGAAVDAVFAQLGESTDHVLGASCRLTVSDEHIELEILFVFDAAATDVMVNAAKKLLDRHAN
jgi:chemotaxis protein CheC